MRNSQATLVMQSLLPGDYNLTLEALNAFDAVDASPVVCSFRVMEDEEAQVDQTKVGWLVGYVILCCVVLCCARCLFCCVWLVCICAGWK